MMKKLLLSAVLLCGINVYGAKIINSSSDTWKILLDYEGLNDQGKTIEKDVAPGQTIDYDFTGDTAAGSGMWNLGITLITGECSRHYLYGKEEIVQGSDLYGPFKITHPKDPNTSGMQLNTPTWGDVTLTGVPTPCQSPAVK